MKKELDIYNYNARLETSLNQVSRAPISDRNKELIRAFADSCVLRNISKARVCRVVEVTAYNTESVSVSTVKHEQRREHLPG